MNYILFDDINRKHLLPFTHTRPVADIRCGILTMRERWELCLQQATGSLTQPYLSHVFPTGNTADAWYVNGGVFATYALVMAIQALQPGQALVKGNDIIAARLTDTIHDLAAFYHHTATLPAQYFDQDTFLLQRPWDIFAMNDRAIREDYALITNGRKSAAIPAGVTVTGAEHIFIEEGANIYAGSIINATTGPVYIGKDVEILEGCMLRGPLAVCEHGVLKMGAKVYGATTIGPGCKAGGEISNVVFFANSNKGHDGFLGNAVIGEWCNLGADTNCSNLKNNYDEVQVWSEAEDKLVRTGLTFCGLLMGDHSKCSINSMFNTGTVTGVSCNIFGGGFPEKFVPSFSWGMGADITTYAFDKAMETANRMMARRGKKLSDAETEMYRHIFEHTKAQRN